mmetsp:Transcript_24392/g.37983  ORF Transcript_24392/g.37983 Transcript_24392/m.37983 type:complete len:106 (-) Transcript_24392:81-398(-)
MSKFEQLRTIVEEIKSDLQSILCDKEQVITRKSCEIEALHEANTRAEAENSELREELRESKENIGILRNTAMLLQDDLIDLSSMVQKEKEKILQYQGEIIYGDDQ